MVRSVLICGVVVLVVSVAISWLIVNSIQALAHIDFGYAYVLITTLPLGVGVYLTVQGLRMNAIKSDVGPT
jgi:hypothetical protein